MSGSERFPHVTPNICPYCGSEVDPQNRGYSASNMAGVVFSTMSCESCGESCLIVDGETNDP